MNDNNQSSLPVEGGLDIARYAQLVLARKRLFIVVVLLVMVVSVVVCYSLPKKYEAKSVVFIEQNVIRDLVKGIAITPSMDMKIKAIKVTMLSRTMLQKVIKELDLDVSLVTGADWDKLITSLNNKLNIRLDEKRGVFNISFTDRDPVLSRDVVNALTRLYIEEKTSEKRKESYEATQFLAEQIEVFKGRINEIEAEIDTFKTESGLILAADESNLREEIEQSEEELEALNIKLDELKKAKSLLVVNTPSKTLLVSQQRMLQNLRATYTDNHPKVIRLKSAIESTEQQVRENKDAERQQIYSSGEYQSIKMQLVSLETIKQNLEADIAERREMLRQIPSLKTKLVELERRRQNEVIIYEKLVSRYGQSEVSKEMELQDKSVSFKVLDPAVVPSSPVSPNRPLILLGGIVLGIGLGIGLIVLMDLINPSIKSADDLRDFGVPIFAIVPKVEDPTMIQDEKKQDLRTYVLAGIVTSVFLFFLAIEALQVPLVDTIIDKIKAA